MIWELKDWSDLKLMQLHAIYKLRTDVFVVEQGCAYPEVDEHDLVCKHLMLWQNDELIAYARICPPNSVYPQASIGRIVVHENHRFTGYGKELVQKSLAALKAWFPKAEVKIQAQEYLEKFYTSFGFRTITDSYPDAMVMHVDMILEE